MAKKKPNEEEISQGLPGYLPPEERHCKQCGKVLRPYLHYRAAYPGEEGVAGIYPWPMVPVSVVHYGYGYDALFCTLRCGYRWACAHAKGGVG